MKSFKIWLCLSDYYMTYSSDIMASNPFLDDFFSLCFICYLEICQAPYKRTLRLLIKKSIV